tara:strand:- start:422 stop:961 length:540 start_codon:yes stop_codon:yes gene_type:complete
MNIICDIKDFLADDYEVCGNFFKDSCVIDYPGRKESLIAPEQCRYSIIKYSSEGVGDRHGLSIVKFNKNKDKIKDCIVNMPNYALRTYIICDIVKSCVLLSYPYSLVNYRSNDKEISQNAIFDVFLLPDGLNNPENIKKEDIIREIFLSGNYNKEDSYQRNIEGVEEGFNLLWNIFWEV